MTLVIIIAAVVTAFIKGAKLPGLSRLALRAEVPSGATGCGSLPPVVVALAETQTAVSQPAAPETLIGQQGVTETSLRPFGKVRLGGRTYDAVSELAFLEPGVKVVVLRVSASGLVVREAAQLPGSWLLVFSFVI